MPSITTYTPLARLGKMPGLSTLKELAALHDAVEMLDFPTGDILEIGTFCARSACALALPRIYPVTTIDPHEGKQQEPGIGEVDVPIDTFEFALGVVAVMGLEEWVEIVVSKSENYKWPHGKSIVFLFIDGYHSYRCIKHDFDKYEKYVVEGGLIGLHDYGVYSCVKRFYRDRLKNNDRFADHSLTDSLMIVEKLK